MTCWRSINYAATFYGKSIQQITRWCKDGTLADAKVPVYQDKSKRWWIYIPEEDLKTTQNYLTL
jgi:hypothetical protein